MRAVQQSAVLRRRCPLSNVYKDHQDPPKIYFYVTLHAGGQGRVRASHGGSQAVPIRPGLSSLE